VFFSSFFCSMVILHCNFDHGDFLVQLNSFVVLVTPQCKLTHFEVIVSSVDCSINALCKLQHLDT